MKYQRGISLQKINIIPIIVCRHEENIFCIIINHEDNRRLFNRYLLLRDNGTVTIGTNPPYLLFGEALSDIEPKDRTFFSDQ